MNHKLDISSLITAQEKIIQNGRAEAEAPKDTLERMMYTAIREGRAEDAATISSFVQEIKKEIITFRKMAQIGRNVKETGIGAWMASLLPTKAIPSVTPRKIAEIVEKQISPQTPFLCIEGVSAGEKSGVIAGPYFAVLASNVSEATDLAQDNTLVCTFSRAVGGSDAIGLRIWKFTTFKDLFKGDTLETSQIGLLPDANSQVTKLNGSVQELFLTAADHMGRAALSKNPPVHVADEWLNILRQYGGIALDNAGPA